MKAFIRCAQRLRNQIIEQPQGHISNCLLPFCYPTARDKAGLGVDSEDSLLEANQIQGCFLGGSLGV